LKILNKNGYRTSVSIEPFLSNPKYIVEKISDYVSDDIWIGCMSGLNTNTEIDKKHKDELNELYSRDSLKNIINTLKWNDKIFWKTSVMKVLLKK
jgi:hypothetical protein